MSQLLSLLIIPLKLPMTYILYFLTVCIYVVRRSWLRDYTSMGKFFILAYIFIYGAELFAISHFSSYGELLVALSEKADTKITDICGMLIMMAVPLVDALISLLKEIKKKKQVS